MGDITVRRKQRWVGWRGWCGKEGGRKGGIINDAVLDIFYYLSKTYRSEVSHT